MPLIVCRDCTRIREKHRKGRCGECYRAMERERNKRRMKGGNWLTLKQGVLRRDGYRCTHVENGVRCTATEQLEVHHVDGDPSNNRLENLTTLCAWHHRGVGRR